MAVKAGGKTKLTLIVLGYQSCMTQHYRDYKFSSGKAENAHKYLSTPALLTSQAASGKFLTGLVAVRNGKLRICLWMGRP